MNSVSGTSLARHHYKAAGHPWPVLKLYVHYSQRGKPRLEYYEDGKTYNNNEILSRTFKSISDF
jgi:hypothetical protein